MKNFTNNFKQFTSRLSARWLIMALMLLVGTSSAWGANSDYYLRGGFNSWNTNNRFDANGTCTISLSANTTYEFKIAQSDWSKEFTYTTKTITATSNDLSLSTTGSNAKITTNAAGSYVFTFSETGKTLSVTYPASCTPATSITSAELQPNGTISLVGDFTTCGKQYHGFQWRIKGQEWCPENDPQSYSGYITKNSDVDGEDNDTFTPTPGNTYEFRTYIYGTPWIYSTETKEVSTCIELPNDAYALSSISAEWTNSDITPTISKKDENYPTPTITYNGGSALPNKPGEYTIKATVSGDATYCNKEFDLGTFTITCPTIAAPAITTSATVCEGTKVTLSSYNGDNTNTVKWYSSQEFNSEVTEQVTLTDDDTKYYAKAYHEASGCYSSEYSTLTFTVNPLPNISISGNNSAVLYEDVELNAATDGTSISWEITEGDGSLSSTTGNSVTLTSSSAGTVTVTATATLGSCTATDTHEVEFSAENCADVTTTVEETVGKIKLLLSKPSWIGGSEKFYCYAWVNNTSTTLLGGWPGTELTQKEGDYYYVVVDANNKDIKIILNDNSEQTVDSDVLNANKIYQISATSSKNSDNKYTFNSKTDKGTYKESVTTTVPAPITAPAAKTISVSTTDGEGNIIFSGQVVKTGCDATNEYGFQYSSDEQTWTTVKVGENAAAGTAISNNTVKGLDGTYYVRAYITNDNSTQYGAVTEITVSTTKIPITSVVLTHVKDVNGTAYSAQELANLIYCAGETVWFKLEQDGSKFQDYQWISYPGSDLVGMYAAGTFSLTLTDSGNVGIRLKNDANDDWVESNLLEFNTHPVAISPTISFENATICSNSTATLKLGALVVGQSYELYKEIENEGVYSEERVGDVTLTCNSIEDDLEFTGLNESGKYFVKGYTAQCPDYKVSSQTATLEIVDASSVYITLNPTEATTTPWMPAKFTVNASDKYTLNVTKGNPAEAATEVEVSQNGNNVSVKIPLPEDATGGEGQYENVSFPQDATTSYTVTANLVSIGGEDNPCAVPATATITLNPYVEDCTTIGH